MAVLALPLALAQQKPQENPSPAPHDFSKEAYVFERWYTRVTHETDGTGSRERSAQVKILSQAGLKTFAVLSFPYTSANETVDIDYVRVRKPDGSVVNTPEYNIQDMPAEVSRSAPLYSDVHEKHIAVKGLAVGDLLEYVVRARVLKPEVPGHFWYDQSFIKNAIARDERLEINVPAGKYVKVVSPEFKPEIAEENGRRIYRWKHENLIVPEKDPNEIPRRIPPNPDVQLTTFSNWEQVGNWYGGLQKDPLEVTAAIQAKAAELTKSAKSDDEKIHALYNFVALKYHYIGLDFGIGRYQPHAADDVLDNGYGDCKDKHTLLAALLKAAGIEAWPALIHGTRKLDPDVPSPAQFNHVITVVPRAGAYLWLDTTPEVSPYGLLLRMLRDKQALVIPVSKPPLLMTTPANAPFPEEMEFSMQGKLGGDGTFTGHAEQSYRGDTEVVLRAVFRQVSESQWKEAVQRFSYGLNFGGDVSNVKMTSPDDLDRPFQLSYDYVRKNYADWESSKQIISPLPPMGVEFPKESPVKKPLEPYPLNGPGTIIYRSRLELPPGYKATAPASCHLVQPFAEYSDDTRIEDGVMTTNRKLVIRKSEVPLSDWEEFRKFGRAVSDDEYAFVRLNRGGLTREPIDIIRPENSGGDSAAATGTADEMFHQATAALQRRDVMQAQQLLEKVIKKDPKYKNAHRSLGAILMAQNRPADALAEFQKEEEISPDDVRTIQSAVYVANLTGNKDLAVAEARKLMKADPTNQTAASTLAGLLTDQKKYSEAVEVLETAVKNAPDSANLQCQLGDVYLKNKQPEQAVSHFKTAVEHEDNAAMMLNNIAYALADARISLDLAKQYGEKSEDELEHRARNSASSESEEMQTTYDYTYVWDTLGWVYFQQGDLKRAEGWVRSAWLLGEETPTAEHLGEIYEKEGKNQQAAQMYVFALAVSPVPGFATKFPTPNMPGMATPNLDRSLVDKIVARYEKLTGKKPTAETRRLPNGEWTQTPAEQLRHSREVKISNEGKRSGSAQFTLVLKEDKTTVRYASGDDTLEPLLPKLEAAHYPLELPPDSGAILTVRLDVNCQATSACIAKVVNPAPPRPQAAGGTY